MPVTPHVLDTYDVIGHGVSTSALRRDVAAAARLHARIQAGSRILEIGAGYGGHAAALAGHGHRVVAVERSTVRAAHARRSRPAGDRLTVVEGDISAVDVGTGFDVVVCRNSFGCGDMTTWTTVLTRIPEWFTDTGRAYLDVFDPAWWGGVDRLGRSAGGQLRSLRYSRHQRRIRIAYREPAGSWVVEEQVWCLRRDEMTLLAAAAGLAARNGSTSPERGTYEIELRRA